MTAQSVPKNPLLIFPGYLLFFLMLVAPTIYQGFKAILLVMVLGGVLFGAIVRNGGVVRLHRTILRWALFYVTIGVIFILRGAMNDAPGALRVGTIYVLWPLLFTLLLGGIDAKTIFNLMRIIIAATFVICLYSLSFIFNQMNILPIALFPDMGLKQTVSFYAGYSRFNSPLFTTIIFSAPFIFTGLIAWYRKREIPVRWWLLLTVFVLCVVLILFSGRIAMFLVVLLLPGMVYFFNHFVPDFQRRHKRKLLITICFVSLLSGGMFMRSQYFDLDAGSMMDYILHRLDRGASALEGDVRKEQLVVLLDEWAQNPLLGAGHGAVAGGYIRSETQTWGYEYTYVALLFWVGIIGLAAYSSGVIWIYWMGICIIREGGMLSLYMLPIMVGLTSFLIANATNNYLGTFDFMWVLFLPLAVINHWLIARRGARI